MMEYFTHVERVPYKKACIGDPEQRIRTQKSDSKEVDYVTYISKVT